MDQFLSSTINQTDSSEVDVEDRMQEKLKQIEQTALSA
jgi:hypothetical protein